MKQDHKRTSEQMAILLLLLRMDRSHGIKEWCLPSNSGQSISHYSRVGHR